MPYSLSGFFNWFEELPQRDQGSDFGKNAINISTYHSAKGLEWPLVIMMGLDENRKSDVFGIDIITTHLGKKSDIDLDDPLINRCIRFWIQPSTSLKNSVYKTINDSSVAKEYIKKNLYEKMRLFYVGMTRARDYLILVSMDPEKSLSWPKFLMEESESGEKFELPKNVYIRDFSELKDKYNNEKKQTVTVLKESKYKRDLSEKITPFLITPSTADSDVTEATPTTSSTPNEFISYGTGLTINGKYDKTIFGNCFHDLLCLGEYYNEKDDKKIQRLIQNYGLHENVTIDDVKKTLNCFSQFINNKFGKRDNRFYEIPVYLRKEGQLISSICDMVIEGEKGLILIDHKTHSGNEAELLEDSKKHLTQMVLYEEVLENAFNKKVDHIFINYISSNVHPFDNS